MRKEVDIQALLESLTLEEKIGQFQQLATFFYVDDAQGEITGPLADLGIDEQSIWESGSVLGINNAEEAIAIQTRYLEKSRHKIPLLLMADIIHGYRTIFPVPLAIGCSWNAENAVKCAKVSGKEAALSGVHVTFSPMADLVRDPRWGRVMESTGEDPYLNGVFARAFVKGYQGDMTGQYDIAACVKHFAAYGAGEAGREYNTVDMSDRQLREYYLPAYKAALDEGARMVMTAFNTVHGVPATGNAYLMREILRDEWGFDGVVISDWGAVGEMLQHGIAADTREVAKKAIEAGVDIEMMTSHYVKGLKGLVEEGIVPEALIDEGVRRILILKKELGLFENPFKVANAKQAEEAFLCEEHKAVAREVATESMVLLKNEGILPLKRTQTVALIGPIGDSGDLLGPWSWQGKLEETTTLKQGLLEKITPEQLTVVKGCAIQSEDTSGFDEAIKAAKEADVVILALGEAAEMSGEGGSRACINLPGVQEQLAEAIFALNKPTAVVLVNGRPLDITRLSDKVPAILEAWFPGTEGGSAIADVLYGDVNPSGKLTMSFPYTLGQVPVYYNCFNTGRPKVSDTYYRYVTHFLDIPNEPLYPFGHGLSYASFEYSDFSLSQVTMGAADTIVASVNVTNTSEVTGKETVQLYLRDLVGSTVRPLRELKAYEQVTLQPGETKHISFTITGEMLKYHDIKSRFVAEAGTFHAMVGTDSNDVLTQTFALLENIE